MRGRPAMALAAVAWFAGCTLLGENLLDDKPLAGDAGSGAGAGTGGVGGDGAGGVMGECVEHGDCPGLDTTCRFRECSNGACSIVNAAAGTSCDDDGGIVCEGDGGCVECVDNEDCLSGDSCVQHYCVPPHCVDGVEGDGETDVDCGGGECAPCGNGLDCAVALDCLSKFCDDGTCAPCQTTPDCTAVPDSYCGDDGVCRPQKQTGDSCDAAEECLSGFCPGDDGLCCDGACAQTCEACLMIKSGSPNGSCGAVNASADPDSECGDQGAASCGANNTGCNGNAGNPGCNLYDSSTECAAGSCAGNVESEPGLCDGAGTCLAGATDDCSPYTCGASACLGSCSANSDCVMTHYCAGGGTCEGCGTSPLAPGGGCPGVCNGGCGTGTQCIINCGNSACLTGKVCPAGFECQVNCTGNSACLNGTITCPTSHACDINCGGGNQACQGTIIQCGDASCDLNCTSGNSVCNNTNLQCGNGSCNATCGGTPYPMVTCNDSCSCGGC